MLIYYNPSKDNTVEGSAGVRHQKQMCGGKYAKVMILIIPEP